MPLNVAEPVTEPRLPHFCVNWLHTKTPEVSGLLKKTDKNPVVKKFIKHLHALRRGCNEKVAKMCFTQNHGQGISNIPA